MKGRRPTSEGRKKAETRTPNAAGTAEMFQPETAPVCRTDHQQSPPSAFGFRASAFFRPSGFGLWIWPFLLLVPFALALPSSPDPNDIPPLRPPHGELPPGFWERYGPWSLAAVLLLVVLVAGILRLILRPKPPLLVPPAEAARTALEPLRQQPEDGALLSRVSQIVRHYFAAAFSLPPEELTTTEFCRALADTSRPGPELSTAVAEFLRQCDQRKFAAPSPAPPLSAVAQATKLIDEAQAKLAQPPPAPPNQQTSPS
jgi:hypothetical protein